MGSVPNKTRVGKSSNVLCQKPKVVRQVQPLSYGMTISRRVGFTIHKLNHPANNTIKFVTHFFLLDTKNKLKLSVVNPQMFVKYL